MFSGIVEGLASVYSVEKPLSGSALIKVDLAKLGEGVRVGDSVSINGVCLTVKDKRRRIVSFDAIEETLSITNLGQLVKGSRVNIERSLRPMDRIGGHLVTGHVDGTGKVLKVRKGADRSVKLFIEADSQLLSMMVAKGSVAVDGISLTIIDLDRTSFSVGLIPHTLSTTTLGYGSKGDLVNVEVDILGKYVKRQLELMYTSAERSRIHRE